MRTFSYANSVIFSGTRMGVLQYVSIMLTAFSTVNADIGSERPSS